METKDTVDIAVQTLRMQPPEKIPDGTTRRVPSVYNQLNGAFVAMESFLRTLAYAGTTITTGADFFDDSDMRSAYYLVVVYDKLSNTPLLSSRYYFDRAVIAKYLKGDAGAETELSCSGKKVDPESYAEGDLFLADRLSGNINSALYRQHRSSIFSLYYSEMAAHNKNCTLLLMVRKEKRNKQLDKYLSMGFSLVGSALHKGKEHSIILRDLKND